MRRRMGGRSPSVFNSDILLRRLESCKDKSSLEDMVEYLRSSFPDYRRIKRQPFTKLVQQTLERKRNFSASVSNASDLVDEDSDSTAPSYTPACKKLKRIGVRERKQREQVRPSTTAAASSSSSDDDDETDGAVSTAEDAIYQEKVEPECDLMRSMLRTSYKASKRDCDTKAKEKDLEVEVINKEKKTGLIVGDGIETLGPEKSTDSKTSRERKLSNGNGYEVKGKDGPRFRDFGGIQGVLDELIRNVIIPFHHPHLLRELGIQRPTAGILLHGPPGCGKTALARAIANETGVPFYMISANEVVSGVSGASEEFIRDLFSKAYRTAPSIVFIDEVDAIASKRENMQREMERRIVTQLMTCMDESHQIIKAVDVGLNSEASDSRPGHVLVIGATNRPDTIDPALRRPGRFDREFFLGVPDENARIEILSVLTRNLKLEGTFDLMKIARSTPGFVGTDLAAIIKEAANLAMRRIIDRRSDLGREPKDGDHSEEWWKRSWAPEEIEGLRFTMTDFEVAVKMVQPCLRREGFSTIPNVTWEDIGGLDALRKEFDRHIVRCIKYPELCKEFGKDSDTGFLLYGPPGCGKTLIAKAVANEAGVNFIYIKGPELLNKYVGESESAVRTIFSRARTCSPCIIFFDEVDALTRRRGKEGGSAVDGVLNQLLVELDGYEQRRGVFVIGATNMHEVMDPAVLRSGRFGTHFYVPLPSPDERGLILKALARKMPIDPDVDLMAIGRSAACKNLSGADLDAVLKEAAWLVLDKIFESGPGSSDAKRTIEASHIKEACIKIRQKFCQKFADR